MRVKCSQRWSRASCWRSAVALLPFRSVSRRFNSYAHSRIPHPVALENRSRLAAPLGRVRARRPLLQGHRQPYNYWSIRSRGPPRAHPGLCFVAVADGHVVGFRPRRRDVRDPRRHRPRRVDRGRRAVPEARDRPPAAGPPSPRSSASAAGRRRGHGLRHPFSRGLAGARLQRGTVGDHFTASSLTRWLRRVHRHVLDAHVLLRRVEGHAAMSPAGVAPPDMRSVPVRHPPPIHFGQGAGTDAARGRSPGRRRAVPTATDDADPFRQGPARLRWGLPRSAAGRAARPARGSSSSVAGLPGWPAPTELMQAGQTATVSRGLRPASAAAAGRCVAPSPPASSSSAAASSSTRATPPSASSPVASACRLDNLLAGRGERHRAVQLASTVSPYTYEEATDDIKADLAEVAQRPVGGQLPDAVRLLHAAGRRAGPRCRSSTGSSADVPGRACGSRLGQLLEVAYTIEYGAEASEQSSLNLLYLLGLLRPGPAAHLRPVEREVPRRAAATTRSPPGSPQRSAIAVRLGSELESIVRQSGRHRGRSASCRARGASTCGGPGRAGAPVLDPAHAGLLEGRLLGRARCRRSASSASARTPSSMSSSRDRIWVAQGKQRRDVRRPRLPEHVGGDAGPSRGARASSSTTRAARTATRFRTGIGDRPRRSVLRARSTR